MTEHGHQTAEPYIPQWDACSIVKDDGRRLSALEQFVYDNEPAGEDEAREWRSLLLEALKEISNG